MCYDLIVSCYLLFVMIVPVAHGKNAPLLKEKNVSRWFAIPPQSQAVCTTIAPRFHINRRFRCFTRRAGSLLPRAETTAASLQ